MANNLKKSVFTAVSFWGSKSFQDAFSPLGIDLQAFYGYVMLFIVFILSLVLYWIYFILKSRRTNRFLVEGKWVEFGWTVFPVVCLSLMVLPSIRLLYIADDIREPTLTVNAVGHQWYWSYEYPVNGLNGKQITFDSYMDVDAGKGGGYRLLDVDHRLVLPVGTHIRLIVVSQDVIHSFALPGLMLNVDAVPGRLNQVPVFIYKAGILYGQCSEICGANHSFIPIVVECVPQDVFAKWYAVTSELWGGVNAKRRNSS